MKFANFKALFTFGHALLSFTMACQAKQSISELVAEEVGCAPEWGNKFSPFLIKHLSSK